MAKKAKKRVVGVDEVGRGPLAGPVVAVACFFLFPKEKLLPQKFWKEIKDSKKYSPLKRKETYQRIIKSGVVVWGKGTVSEKKIDKINILEATKIAMKKALEKVGYKDSLVLIDGNFLLDINCEQKAVAKGDEKILECSVASVIAKVERDRLMERYHKKYPRYGFDKHKGYGTERHRKMIEKHGSCFIHRKSFRLF